MNTYEKYAEKYLDAQYEKLSSKAHMIADHNTGEKLEELGLKYHFLGRQDKAVKCMEKAVKAYRKKHNCIVSVLNSERADKLEKWLDKIRAEMTAPDQEDSSR
ncbi:hypothetical protein [Ruminococcus albus]|uniref:Tetratricopeptide repeat-containing protein n=1 Tax=Ruminococcus albus TaxID=1264 RepID=A0A1I1RDJ3_RUMAL|nr:hypothetical protein [Ruminococcus albus]SFD30208.1 hypothetical protein SAMN02910406_03619 [Ruminococcus albus]